MPIAFSPARRRADDDDEYPFKFRSVKAIKTFVSLYDLGHTVDAAFTSASQLDSTGTR